MGARPVLQFTAYCVTLRPGRPGHNSAPALVSPGEPARVHTAVSDNAPADVRPEIVRGQRDGVAVVAIVAVALVLWVVAVGYQGIIHDARLYSMQALAKLHPELLGQDLFLRFGSQDRFTFFSPVYATVSAWLGLESAAALITLISQAAFFTAAAFVARQLLPARMALLSVALLIAIPSEYGPGNMFHAVEPFITPRMAAEALALAALAAVLSKKHLLAGAFLLVGLLLHPLMAMAGVAMVVTLAVALPKPRIAIALGVAGMVALALLAMGMPSLRIDDAWRTVILDRMPYVFLSQWSIESAARACTPLVTLTVGLLVLPLSRARQIAVAAIVIGLAGLLLTVYGSDLLRIALVTQSQPWRWLWLTNTVMILLLPLIFSACWERGYVGRATIGALVAMWLFRSDVYGAVLMLAALGLAIFSRSPRSQAPATRVLWFGSLAFVAFGVVNSVANNALFAGTLNPVANLSTPLAAIREFTDDGFAAALVLFIVWLVVTRAGRASRTGMAVFACVLFVCLVPFAFREWTTVRFSESAFEAFAPWRARIPVGTEVLWMDAIVDGWVLLQRPQYLGIDQTGSALFSRDAALEMERRDAVLTKYLPIAHLMMPKTHVPEKGIAPSLERACASGEIRFIATRVDLNATPVERAPASTPLYRGLSLYECPT